MNQFLRFLNFFILRLNLFPILFRLINLLFNLILSFMNQKSSKIPFRKSISFQTLGADGNVIDALCVEDADINSLVSVLNLCHDGYIIHIDVSETSPVSYGLNDEKE